MVTPCRSSTLRNQCRRPDRRLRAGPDLASVVGLELGANAQKLFWDCAKGERPLDVFVFEGTVIEAPNGTGRMDMFADRPMKDWVTDLAKQAGIVVAIGDCACWGGIRRWSPTRRPQRACSSTNATKAAPGPELQVQGRPAGDQHPRLPGPPGLDHPDHRCAGHRPHGDIALDELQRSQTFFKTFTQTGCTRVQFYEYKQSTESFGEGTRTGCLFYEFGCRGPMTHSPCNRILWNRQSSKTRAGHPCIGCTEPEFPHFDLAPGTLFKTQKVAG